MNFTITPKNMNVYSIMLNVSTQLIDSMGFKIYMPEEFWPKVHPPMLKFESPQVTYPNTHDPKWVFKEHPESLHLLGLSPLNLREEGNLVLAERIRIASKFLDEQILRSIIGLSMSDGLGSHFYDDLEEYDRPTNGNYENLMERMWFPSNKEEVGLVIAKIFTLLAQVEEYGISVDPKVEGDINVKGINNLAAIFCLGLHHNLFSIIENYEHYPSGHIVGIHHILNTVEDELKSVY